MIAKVIVRDIEGNIKEEFSAEVHHHGEGHWTTFFGKEVTVANGELMEIKMTIPAEQL